MQQEKKMSKDTSALIGQKLLQGWTMLADMCPNSEDPKCMGVPLMKERGTQRMLCVNCGVFYVKVQDPEDASSFIVVPEKNVRAATKKEVETGKVEEKKKPVVEEVEEEEVEEEIVEEEEEEEKPKVCCKKAKVGSHGADVKFTVNVLYKKLNEATKKLDSATDSRIIADLCNEIIVISKAIKEVSDL